LARHAGDDLGQRNKQRRLRRVARFDPIQLPLIGGQIGQALGRRGIALIGNVISASGKMVDHLDRPAQFGGHKEGGNREIFVMFDGHGAQSIRWKQRQW
jgi:hypothetical protein